MGVVGRPPDSLRGGGCRCVPYTCPALRRALMRSAPVLASVVVCSQVVVSRFALVGPAEKGGLHVPVLCLLEVLRWV